MSLEYRIKLLVFAFFIDALLGDPHYRLHPVRLIGDSVELGERLFYGFKHKKLAGFVCYALLALMWLLLGFALEGCWFLHLFFLYSFLATGQLWKEVREIGKLVKKGRLNRARSKLSLLVTRDTSTFGEDDIVRTALETLSENTSDGFFGPAFFYILGGIPFLFLYKFTETADSMVGYKNDRYLHFGWAFAKADDILNFVPSRLCALFIVFSSFVLGFDYKNATRCLKYASLHESLNAGYPEAAFAGALGIRFGGFYRYFGKQVFKFPLGEDNIVPNVNSLEKGLFLSVTSVVLFMLFACAVFLA